MFQPELQDFTSFERKTDPTNNLEGSTEACSKITCIYFSLKNFTFMKSEIAFS